MFRLPPFPVYRGAVHEQNFTEGYNYSDSELDIKSCYLFDYAINNGTIYAEEGFTELQPYYEDGKWVSLVEFSTPSGTKRGFVNSSSMHITNVKDTSVARVIASSSPAYAGPDNSYVKLGGVYDNEFVAILARNGDWAYSEYNTANGRKRGYIKYSDLSNYQSRTYPADKKHISLKKATKELSVYGGPNSNYANIGTVFNQEIVSYLGTERNYSYVEYTTTNGSKRGYVPTSSLTTATVPTLPNIPTYSNFISGTYGYSGEGEALKWYQLGSGKNVVFAVFEQHGWEDAWASDGIELVKIANTMMSKLSSMNQSTFNDWTIYVIPYANPDGITDGYTNNGPGRCTVSKKVDMNRCWPAYFEQNYTSRNYTGSSPLGAPEAVYLENFISNRFGSATNIVLDIHGWLNKTYGNSQVGSYFGQQFGFSHRSTHGNGYLETWAYNKGAKSCLVELPMPSSSSSITSNNYAGKLTNALVNMVKNIGGGSSSEGGTVVNDLCEVSTNSSVNVRSGPGTSYGIVTSLKNGTRVTRIKKAVATANGYTWDKIVLSDGRIGYMATNYLVVVNDDYGYAKYQLYTEMMAIKAYLKYNTSYFRDGTVDQQYNNELIGAIEEYQKAYQLSLRDGTITNEVLTHMGFSVDTNGKIVKNTFYNLYFKKAENYRKGYDPDAVPYYDFTYTVNNEVKSGKYVLGKTSTTVLSSIQKGIDEMESKYGQLKNDTEEAQEKRASTRRKMNLLIVGGDALGLDAAADSLRRYLENTGSKLEHDNIQEILDKSASSNSIYEALLLNAKKATEQMMPNQDGTIKFSLDVEATGNCTRDDSLDWYASMNNYRIEIICTATKIGNSYTLNYQYIFKDYYDWIEGGTAEFNFGIASIIEDEGFQLHYAGEARAFHQSGTISKNYTWTKGNI